MTSSLWETTFWTKDGFDMNGKMKRGYFIVGVFGSSALCIGAYLYLNWTEWFPKRKKENTGDDCDERRHQCQRKLSFRVDCGDGVRNNTSANVVKVFTTTPQGTPEAHDKDGMQPDESESFTSSLTSMTSCDDDSTSNTCSDKSSESETGIAGAVGVSTYNNMQGNMVLSNELDELAHSPIVTDLFTDRRFQRHDGEKELLCSPQVNNVVVEFEGTVTPVDVNESIETIGGLYSSIVPPLQPNTGIIFKTES